MDQENDSGYYKNIISGNLKDKDGKEKVANTIK